jgi:hypothetical protein
MGGNNKSERMYSETVGANLRNYPGICLDTLWKTTENLK